MLLRRAADISALRPDVASRTSRASPEAGTCGREANGKCGTQSAVRHAEACGLNARRRGTFPPRLSSLYVFPSDGVVRHDKKYFRVKITNKSVKVSNIFMS